MTRAMPIAPPPFIAQLPPRAAPAPLQAVPAHVAHAPRFEGVMTQHGPAQLGQSQMHSYEGNVAAQQWAPIQPQYVQQPTYLQQPQYPNQATQPAPGYGFNPAIQGFHSGPVPVNPAYPPFHSPSPVPMMPASPNGQMMPAGPPAVETSQVPTEAERKARFESLSISMSHAEMREQAKAGPKRRINQKDEALFVREYIRTGRNIDLAMKRIGLPLELGDKFIMRPRVQELLQTWAQVGLTAQDVTADRVVLALGQMAFRDPRESWDPLLNDGKGGQIPLHELPGDLAMAVESVGPSGNYKFGSKQAALNQLTNVFGLNKPTSTTVVNVQHNTTNNVTQTLEMLPEQVLMKMLNVKMNEPPRELAEAIIDAEYEETEA